MIVIDGSGVMQFFSSAAERQFGYGASEAIGQNVNMLMPHPDRHATTVIWHSICPRASGISSVLDES
jgi:PAS domain S-box-containing protein